MFSGNALKEIRDDRLYEADGFTTWDAYLKQRVGEDFGIEKSQVQRLINSAIIRPKLPDAKIINPHVGKDKAEWSQRAVNEFARLAPPKEDAVGRPGPDVSKLRKQDVQRVAKRCG